jgi:hypothetical protein
MPEIAFTYAKMPTVFRLALIASFVAVGVVVSIHNRKSAGAETHRNIPTFALSAEGFTTASDVRPHNRVSLDSADINEALSSFPPDYTGLGCIGCGVIITATGSSGRSG